MLTWPVLALVVILIAPARVLAHCDGLDGPVVKAAQRALDTRNPAFALIWEPPAVELDFPDLLDAGSHHLFVALYGQAVNARFSYDLTVTPVPEPGSLWLLGAGTAAAVLRQHRRKPNPRPSPPSC